MFYSILLILILFAIHILFIYKRFLKSICVPNEPFAQTPKQFNRNYESVSFQTMDKINISGWYLPNDGDTLLIVTHGYYSNKSNILEGTIFLNDHFHLLYIDFRGHGESQQVKTSIGYNETKDIQAAIQWGKNKDFKKIGLVGISMGGASSIMAWEENIYAMVIDSPFSSLEQMIDHDLSKYKYFKNYYIWWTKCFYRKTFGFSTSIMAPIEKIKIISSPIFLLHGENDQRVPIHNAKKYLQNNPKIQFWSVANAEHCEAHELYPDEHERKLTEFLKLK